MGKIPWRMAWQSTPVFLPEESQRAKELGSPWGWQRVRHHWSNLANTYNWYTFDNSSSVLPLSRVQLFVIPWTAACQASLSITSSWSLLKLMSIESVIPSSHRIICHPLLPPSIFPSIRVFSNQSVLHIRWSKYWSCSFGICPSNEYSGLTSFRIDWLDFLVAQGTRKSLQHHSSKASILWQSAFFIVQLSHPYMTTGKKIALTRQIFVGKVMFLFLPCYLDWS